MEQETRQQVFSTVVKSGANSYFFDVREAKNGKKYLVISQSRFNKNNERERASMIVFNNDIQNFQTALVDAAGHVID